MTESFYENSLASMNRLGNCRNRNQNDEIPRVLCVCSAGLLRSPTMAKVLTENWVINTRAVGVVDAFALIPLDRVLCEWADKIIFSSRYEKDLFFNTKDTERRYEAKCRSLEVPDVYMYNDPELVKIIQQQMADLFADGFLYATVR